MRSAIGHYIADQIFNKIDVEQADYDVKKAADPNYVAPDPWGSKSKPVVKTDAQAFADYCAGVKSRKQAKAQSRKRG
jgi:hypothetical protein